VTQTECDAGITRPRFYT